MEHVDIADGEIHQPHNFVFASAAARLSTVITDPTLLGKLALQSDDGSFWRLSGVAPAAWTWFGFRNNAGQIQVSYGATLSIVGLVAATPKTFDIDAATPDVSSATVYPFSAPSKTYSAMFDAARGTLPNGRLIENPIAGQPHLWSVKGTYINKAGGEVGSLKIRLRNLASGYIEQQSILLIAGITGDSFNLDFDSIADTTSIPSPNGYVLDALAGFSDVDLTININSITRVSYAVGYGVI